MKDYEHFKRVTTMQVKMNGFISAAKGLEMLALIAELERQLRIEKGEEMPQ